MLSSLIFFSGLLFVLGIPFLSFYVPLIMMWEISLNGLSSGFFLSICIDCWSLGFGLVMTFVACHVYWYSLSYMESVSGNSYFYTPLSAFVMSMILLIFSVDFLCLFLAWDGLGVSSFMLVFFYSSNQSAGGSLITALSNRFGDFCFFLGITFQLSDFEMLSYFGSEGFMSILFLFAAFSKSAQWPLSAWLPAAMAAPTPISSLVHSSTLVTAGVYLLFRVESYIGNYNSFLYTISMVTFFLASMSASLSYDLKRIVAMSTLGHLALMIMALSMGQFCLGFFHLLSHALFKSLLFMGSGNAISSFHHSQDLRDMGGMGILMPVTSQSIFISLISLSGIPFSSGFYSKDLVLEMLSVGGGKDFFLSSSILGFCVMLSVIYCFRVFFFLFKGTSASIMMGLESKSYLISPLISLSLFSIIFGCLGDLLLLPREMMPSFSNTWLFMWMFGGLTITIYLLKTDKSCFEDVVGFNNLCYIRAPYQVLSYSSLSFCLSYLMSMEMGWCEYSMPQSSKNFCSTLSGKSVYFEW